MSELDKPLHTETPEDLKAHKTSLSELLRVGADANAMLLGTTAVPEGEDAGEPTAAAAESPSETKTPDEPGTPSESRGTTREETRTTAGSSTSTRGSLAGLALSAIGVLLLVGQQVSPPIAEILQRVLDPRVLGGVLVVGGLILYTLGVLRRTLRDIQVSVDDVAVESARLERIATDSRAVLDALHTVRLENTTLKEDVSKLQVKIKKLTEIVSNPDYAGSIFRLAASVDLLGKHVEVYMKEQFSALHQRLSAVAQQAEHAEQQLKSAFAQVHALTKEQLRAQQAAVQEGFERQHATSDKAAARIEHGLQVTARIETTIKSQQEAIAKGWALLAERVAQSAGQVTSDLKELRTGIDRQVEAQTAALRDELDGIDAKIGAAERNQTAGILQISEHVRGQLTASLVDLEQGLKLLADLASASHQEVAVEFDELGARLDRQAESQAAALESGIEKLDARIGVAERGHGASLKQLTDLVRGELDGGIEDLQQSLRLLADLSGKSREDVVAGIDGLGTRLDKHAREQQAVLQQTRERTVEDVQLGLKSLADLASKGQRETGAGLEELGARLDKQSREQQASMQQARERSTEATRAAKGELAAILDQLRKRLEEVGREQASALERSSQDARDVAGATRSGLAESLDQIGTRLEKAIEARTRGLTGEMMEVAETVRSITTEVRSCIAESMLRVASSNAELAASRGRAVEWPRIEVEAETADVSPELPVETPVEAAAAEIALSTELELDASPLFSTEPTPVPEVAAAPESIEPQPDIERTTGDSEPPFGSGVAGSPEVPNP